VIARSVSVSGNGDAVASNYLEERKNSFKEINIVPRSRDYFECSL
jgi:hypothetical protein